MFEKRLKEIYPHLKDITYDISAGAAHKYPFPLNSSRHTWQPRWLPVILSLTA
jgi:hypothetical protein